MGVQKRETDNIKTSLQKKGPENLVYFRANGLEDELKRDPRITWIVTFYAAWSPGCINFAPIYSKLSADYGLPNLKFGKFLIAKS